MFYLIKIGLWSIRTTGPSGTGLITPEKVLVSQKQIKLQEHRHTDTHIATPGVESVVILRL